MVQIQVNGVFVDMPPDVKLNINITSPLFSQDYISGSLAYPFELPFTDVNHAIFSFAFEESAFKVGKQFPCLILVSGTPFKEGILYLKLISNKKYSAEVSMDSGLIKNIIAGKDLSQIGLPTINIPNIASTNTRPFVILQLNEIAAGTNKRRLGNFNIYRAGTLINKYKFRWDPERSGNPLISSILDYFHYQVATPNQSNTIGSWTDVMIRNYPQGDSYQGFYAYFTEKFFTSYIGGDYTTKRLFKINSVSNGTNSNNYYINTISSRDPTTQNGYGISYSPSDWDSVDEPIGHWNNESGFKATFIAPNKLKIEDLRNAVGGVITASGDNFSTVTVDNQTVVDGVSPQKIGSFYDTVNRQTWPEAKFAAAPVYNDKFTEDADYKKYQNNVDIDGKIILNTTNTGQQYRNAFTCFPYVAEVLSQIFSISGLNIFGSFFTDTELKTLVLWNNFANEEVLVDNSTGFQLRIPSTNINLNQNLKGLKVDQFLKDFRSYFGVDFEYLPGKGVEIVFKKDIATSTAMDDWSEKEIGTEEIYVEDEIEGFKFSPGPGDSYYSSKVKDTDGFKIKDDVSSLSILMAINTDDVDTIRGLAIQSYNEDYVSLYRCVYTNITGTFKKTWVYFGIRIDGKILGDGSTEITPSIGVPIMYYINENTEGRPRWHIPRVDHECRSFFEIGDGKSPAPLKLMFYRGIVGLSFKNGSVFEAHYVPLANSKTVQFLNDTNFLNYDNSLLVNGDGVSTQNNGLHTKYWKAWCELLLSAKKVKKTFLLTPLDLLTLRLTKKKYCNGKTYLIDKMDFEIGSANEIIVHAYCWRL